MKPIQIMIDPELLEQLDATREVQQEGRSAVLRRAVQEYLDRLRRREIKERYERAYAGATGLGEEYVGWEEEGAWPTD